VPVLLPRLAATDRGARTLRTPRGRHAAPRAFELDRAPSSPTTDRWLSLVAAKYAMPVAQVHTMHERLENNAHALGMTWSLDTAKPDQHL